MGTQGDTCENWFSSAADIPAYIPADEPIYVREWDSIAANSEGTGRLLVLSFLLSAQGDVSE
jgi:hypothetical protein